MMKNLILDCSCGMNVYVVNDNEVFSNLDATQNKHTDEILVVIDGLLKQANLKISDIENICVCVGPGSFTGVRVAISIAKGLTLGINAKVFETSNFDLIETDKQKYYYVLDGFSNYIYVRTNDNGNVFDECITIDEFVLKYQNNKFDIYVSTEKAQNLLKKYEISSIVAKNNAVNCFKQKILKNDFVELNKIYPVYLRASQAEIERDKKLKGVK